MLMSHRLRPSFLVALLVTILSFLSLTTHAQIQIPDVQGLPNQLYRIGRGNTIFAIGDSITYNGTDGTMNASAGYYGILSSNHYLLWATLLSQGRLAYTGVSATGGYTTAQILATHLPVALQVKPAFCVVLGGANDYGQPIPTVIANLKAMYTALQSAGITPVCCTLLPRNNINGNTSWSTRLNAWISRYARLNGLPLADFYSALVDTTNGAYKAGLNADYVHPSPEGAKIMGQVIVNALLPLVAQTSPFLAATQSTDVAMAIQNPLFLNGSGGLPSCWAFLSGVPGTLSMAPASGVVGNQWTITSSTGDCWYRSNSFAVNPGDVLHIAFKLRASVETASNGSVAVSVSSNISNIKPIGFISTLDIPAGAVFTCEVTVPNGVSRILLEAAARGGTGGTLGLGQMTIIDLTTWSLID
jgi:lysophospholipase L1-like esterase